MASRREPVNGPLAVDDRRIHDDLLLEQIRDAYAELYDIGYAGGAYHARRLTRGPLLTAATPGGLATAIWLNWTGVR